MKNRLEIAKELLKENGIISINIDDDEVHYLKILADEIFGRKNFISNIIWQKSIHPKMMLNFFRYARPYFNLC